MAPQVHQADYYNHLAKVGREGFALLEEINRIRRINHQYEHLQPYHGPQIITMLEEHVIDSKQAAQLYGGVVVVDHSIRKPIPNRGY